jgi:hypothetical protein
VSTADRRDGAARVRVLLPPPLVPARRFVRGAAPRRAGDPGGARRRHAALPARDPAGSERSGESRADVRVPAGARRATPPCDAL